MPDDFALKLKMLRLYGITNIVDWYHDVWKREAGEQMCCNGYMCGCQGTDYGSMWEHYWNTRKRYPS